jgi:adenylate kinase
MLIVFIGPPGAGKGTQAAHLTRHLGIAHVSTGELLRQAKDKGSKVGLLAAEYMDRGDLVPDDVMIKLIDERLSEPDAVPGCLLDGFPRTVAQAVALDEILAKQERSLDAVIELVCDDNELVRRLMERAKVEGRADDTPETITRRQANYRQQTAPLVSHYREKGMLQTVNGMQPPHRVFEDLRKIVEEKQSE